jgi:Ca2+-binding RTX toxin-like protein
VPENALGGYFVSQVLGTDPDGDQLNNRIVDQDSPFVLNGNQIFLREGAVLDYETRPVQIVTIEASDGRGGTPAQSFDIKIKDILETPPPSDTIYGTEGSDEIVVVQANVKVYGLGEADHIVAYNGSNLLNGGTGDDFLESGSGSDTLEGGAGGDALWGGLGNDTYIWSAELGTYDWIFDEGGIDILRINGTSDEFTFQRDYYEGNLRITKGSEPTGGLLDVLFYFPNYLEQKGSNKSYSPTAPYGTTRTF